MKTLNWLLAGSTAIFILSGKSSAGENSGESSAKISYSKQIEPILRAKCQGCHQPAKPQGQYEMTNFARLIAGGESGSRAVVPGKPDESYLVDEITPHDGKAEMPKKGPPLAVAEIELIRQWISQGAFDDSPKDTGPRFTRENPPTYVQPPVINSLDFSPDGKWLALSGFHEVLVFETQSWKLTQRMVGLSERIESVRFSPDSNRLAVTGGSPGKMGEVQVWKVTDGTLLLSKAVTYDTIYGGIFSPDGKLIAFGCADNTVRAIDAETGEQKFYQGAHEDWVRSVAFIPNGSHIISAGRDMTCKLTEVATERFIDNVTSITPGALRGGINSLASHPTRDEFLVGGADGVPKVYRVFRIAERRIGDDSNLVRQFPAMPGRIFAVDISTDAKLLAAASTLDGSSSIHVYHYNFTSIVPDEVKKAMEKRIAERSAEEKQLVEQFSTSNVQQVSSIEIPTTSVYAIAFHPDSKRLAIGGADGKVRIVDALSGKVESEFITVDTRQLSSKEPSNLLAAKTSSGLPLASEFDRQQELSKLAKSSLTSLEISPEQIRLNGDRDYVQLLVTAVYADGSRYDVSRQATYQFDTAAVDVSPDGFVRPKSSGASQIKIAFSGQAATVVCDTQNSQVRGIDFIRDVNPILSRLGCNAGTCHGAQKGKNGFKLSLRGYDPIEDIRALADDMAARRLNAAAPDASVMLLKPIGAVPHEGGVLMAADSVYYQTIRQWIAGGGKLDLQSPRVTSIEISPTKPTIELPGAWQQFRVTATFADGTKRDVTREAFIESGDAEVAKTGPHGLVQAVRRGEAPVLARYEGAYAAATLTIMGDRSGFEWEEPEAYGDIDQLVANKWKQMKIQPSPVCTDAEFIRRVYLDLTGLPPSAETVRKFLAEPRPSVIKRFDVIDKLVGSTDYVEHWTNKWADLLQVNSKFLGKEGAEGLRNWIRQSVDENKRYDRFVTELLTATGSNKDNPAASYFKILRDPASIMENTTHLFLAVRFNCNKCHDHPFEKWTQDQYYELASYFSQVGLKKDPASGDRNIGGTAVEGAKPLFEEVADLKEGEIKHERTGKVVSPKFPFETRFSVEPNANRRRQLAAWLTSPENPYFARSLVNRLWGYLTGTGLMEPLDDIRAGNPPTNPELLDYLTNEFVDSNFNIEHVLKLICKSRTYQLSVATNRWNEDDKLNYSHAKARRLPAEVLYDTVYAATGAVSKIPGVAPGTRAAQLADVAVQLPDGFLTNLGRPVRESACECERSQDLQLGPVMALVSGPTVGAAISDPQCQLPQIAKKELSDEELVQEIYLRILNRPATKKEIQTVLSTAQQIDVDHAELTKQLALRETSWKGEFASLEKARLEQLAIAELKAQQREAEIAPARTKLEAERKDKLAAAEKDLAAYDAGAVQLANKYLKDNSHDTRQWFPIVAASLDASVRGVNLTRLPDRSIRARGKTDRGSYTLTVHTPLRNIRGVRLEALASDDLPGKGPGLSNNGNFVVTEFEMFAAPLAKPTELKKVAFKSGKSDFNQEGFGIDQAIDGTTNDQRGWGIANRGGSIHWATLLTAEPVGFDGGTLLKITIHQNHNAQDHRLGNFRISLSVDDGDVELGIPEEFAALATIIPRQRTLENLKLLVDHLRSSDKKWTELQNAVAAAKQPLPPDEQLVQLRERIEQLKAPTADDPKLIQLRKDVSASQDQVQHRRLTLAQDLAWALINSPAFLFNH